MKSPHFLPVILAGLVLSWTDSAPVYKPGVLCESVDAIKTTAPVPVSAAGSTEMDFSPKGGAEVLVLRITDSARTDIKALSRSFTNPRVVAALLRVAKRGVAISLVADYENNIVDDQSGKSQAVLSALAEAGCDVRVIPAYSIYRDKVLTVDRQTVELRGFNYSDATVRVNLENVLANWNNSALAKVYPAHLDRNRRQSGPFRTRYRQEFGEYHNRQFSSH